MNVFKDYTIFMVLIFILSLKKFNAPPNDENEVDEDLKKIRDQCVDEINEVFQVDDLLKKAKIAFENLEQNSEGCYISSINKCHKGNVLAYYMEFKEHLLSNGVPDTQAFCDEQKETVVKTVDCVHYLSLCFGSDKHRALIHMFYKVQKLTLPQMLSHKLNGNDFIDIPVEYFYRVKDTFNLKTGEGGMPPPKEFCDKLHKKKKTQE